MQRRLGLEHERVRRLAPEPQIGDGPALRREHEREARVARCQRLDVVRDERLQQALGVAAAHADERARAAVGDRRPAVRGGVLARDVAVVARHLVLRDLGKGCARGLELVPQRRGSHRQ